SSVLLLSHLSRFRQLPVSCLVLPRLPRTTLFPYTTLFRSLFVFSLSIVLLSGIRIGQVLQGLKAVVFLMTFTFLIQLFTIQPERSEEHTSELQSRENLVCRLLLENKNFLVC